MDRSPVTADDVERSVRLALEALEKAPAEHWERRAGPLEWHCRDTLEHLNNSLFSYALRLAPRTPHTDRGVPIRWQRPGTDGSLLPIEAEPDGGPAAALEVLDAMGGLVAATVRARPASVRAYHTWGVADPEGFAAMAVVETTVHAWDMAQGLGVEVDPPSELCERVLVRLFPDAPTDTPPWATLLWATGRGDLPGHLRFTEWQWQAAPESEL
ncbi:hypothetical protein GCM10027447_20370 [Glycomyces halotolerans]